MVHEVHVQLEDVGLEADTFWTVMPGENDAFLHDAAREAKRRLVQIDEVDGAWQAGFDPGAEAEGGVEAIVRSQRRLELDGDVDIAVGRVSPRAAEPNRYAKATGSSSSTARMRSARPLSSMTPR